VIAVLGAGGVGGLVAAALARAGQDVVVVAREPTAERISEAGIAVESERLGTFTAHPRAVSRLDEPAHVLVVAVKAPALEDALERVAFRPGLVVPLLNGVEHVARLRERFSLVAASVIRVQSTRVAPGEIRHTSTFARVDLAPDRGSTRFFEYRLQGAELDARVSDDEATVLWAKLVRLCPLALVTAAHDAPLGAVRDDPDLDASVGETARVARAEGAAVDAAAVRAELAGLPATASSSLRRDVADGAPNELDAIAGAVVRAGARHGLACPAVERLAARVAARVRGPCASARHTRWT
jgi:2-dehydropantoate 2-reductase